MMRRVDRLLSDIGDGPGNGALCAAIKAVRAPLVGADGAGPRLLVCAGVKLTDKGSDQRQRPKAKASSSYYELLVAKSCGGQ